MSRFPFSKPKGSHIVSTPEWWSDSAAMVYSDIDEGALAQFAFIALYNDDPNGKSLYVYWAVLSEYGNSQANFGFADGEMGALVMQGVSIRGGLQKMSGRLNHGVGAAPFVDPVGMIPDVDVPASWESAPIVIIPPKMSWVIQTVTALAHQELRCGIKYIVA